MARILPTKETIIITSLTNQLSRRGATDISIIENSQLGYPYYQVSFVQDDMYCRYTVSKQYVERYGAFTTIKNIYKELKL